MRTYVTPPSVLTKRSLSLIFCLYIFFPKKLSMKGPRSRVHLLSSGMKQGILPSILNTSEQASKMRIRKRKQSFAPRLHQASNGREGNLTCMQKQEKMKGQMIEFRCQKRDVISSNTVKNEEESHHRTTVAAKGVATKKTSHSLFLSKSQALPLCPN